MDTIRRLVLLSVVVCMSREVEGARREYGAAAGAGVGAGEPLVFAAVPLHAPVPVLHVLSPAPSRRRPPADLELDAAAPLPRYKPPAAGTAAGLASKHRPRPRPPLYRDTDYEESYEYTRLAARKPTTVHNTYEDDYESYTPPLRPATAYSSSHLYSTSLNQPAPAASMASYEPSYELLYAGSSDPGAVLYARPSPSGGYTYRRPAPLPPPAPAPAPAVRPAKEPQYILKIHKYRIVKDRRRR